jgi:hypothetical protein
MKDTKVAQIKGNLRGYNHMTVDNNREIIDDENNGDLMEAKRVVSIPF